MNVDDKLNAVSVNLHALGYADERIDAAIAALRDATPLREPKAPREPEAPLLPPDALCEQLKISRTTLWRLKAPFIQVGGRKRYDRAEVMAFLATQK